MQYALIQLSFSPPCARAPMPPCAASLRQCLHTVSLDCRVPCVGAASSHNVDELMALRDLLVKAREETLKLQAERDAVSGHRLWSLYITLSVDVLIHKASLLPTVRAMRMCDSLSSSPPPPAICARRWPRI